MYFVMMMSNVILAGAANYLGLSAAIAVVASFSSTPSVALATDFR